VSVKNFRERSPLLIGIASLIAIAMGVTGAFFVDRVPFIKQAYKIPAIRLDKNTTKEAVATVFNKVNQGGLRLDNFELLTAIFAGDREHFRKTGRDFRLRDDWAETKKVTDSWAVLSQIKETDFLQMVLLLASLERRADDVAAGKERPRRVTGRGDDVLDLTLDEYLKWAPLVREALPWTAQFFTSLHIHTDEFLPYRTQAVPLTVFRVLLGADADVHTVRARLRRWYWCGVLGELYGGTTETRFARDVEQVPAWARAARSGEAGSLPKSVTDAQFSESRLWSLQTRNSAAYKGLYALQLAHGARDWMYDKALDKVQYVDLNVDIHHIFPKKFCEDAGLDKAKWNSVVNKTPLSQKTNIWLRGDSPAVYVDRLQKDQQLSAERLDSLLTTHLVDPATLRTADFEGFFRARQEALVGVIESAIGKRVFRDLSEGRPTELPEAYEAEPDDLDISELETEDYEGALA
jgi:hypothetical protein